MIGTRTNLINVLATSNQTVFSQSGNTTIENTTEIKFINKFKMLQARTNKYLSNNQMPEKDIKFLSLLAK